MGKQVIADTRLVDDELGTVTDVKGYRKSLTWCYYSRGEYSWMHHLESVDVSTHPNDEVLPQIIGDENVSPPEDCGGTHEYKELKEVLLNPKHLEYKSIKKWVGSKFDPMVCDLKTIQQKLGKLGKLIDE